jgi:hypothetical protein
VAVLCELRVPGGTHGEVTALEQQVGQRLEVSGGPPEGLIFLCVHPDEHGFRIVMVFRSVESAQAEIDGPLRADAAAVGLDLGELAVSPVWSMALPGAH